MNDDFTHYKTLAAEGATPDEVLTAARNDGIDGATLFRLLRSTFGMTLEEAKRTIHGPFDVTPQLELALDQYTEEISIGADFLHLFPGRNGKS